MRADDQTVVPPPRAVSTPGAGNGARSLLILTCVDGALRESTSGSCAAAQVPLVDVMRRGIPVVLTSHHSARELLALQRELGVTVPFIAENGRTLHIPRATGVDRHRPRTQETGEWDVFEFKPPSIEDAVDALLALSTSAGDPPLVIGIGASWEDHVLLRYVDVPVVVRSALVDQRDLQHHVPHAYVTAAAGPAGWSEAVLGSA